MFAPVMYDASSEARNDAMGAISLGLAVAIHRRSLLEQVIEPFGLEQVFRHRCFDEPRTDAVDANAAVGVVDRDLLGEVHDAPFAAE